MSWSFNKGEWTEAYVFCCLLADGTITSGNNTTEKAYLVVEKCIRINNGVRTEYRRDGEERVLIYSDDREESEGPISVPTKSIKKIAQKLLADIRNAKGKRTFESSETEEFLRNSLKISNLKEKCVVENNDDKTDIVLQTFNRVDSSTEEIGFSIKSHLGSPATLFNYSKASSLVYKIVNCDDEMMYKLNSMTTKKGGCDLKKRLSTIKNTPGLLLELQGTKIINKTKYGNKVETGRFFEWNLEHIDTSMIKIINALVLTSYGYYDHKPRTQSLVDITKAVAKHNPLKLHNYETAYVARIKEFLYCAFAGLTASTKWDGTRHVNGGYIDVLKDGQIQYFRAVSDDQFTSYLFNNIKLERPQHGSYCKYMIAEAKRHLDEKYTIPDSVVKEKNEKKKGDYGYVYKDAVNYDPPAYFLDINYSFRFKK